MKPLSRYSMGASLKGASYSTEFSGKLSPELVLVVGFHSPRWDSLLSYDPEVKSIRRRSGGLKLSAFPGEAWRFSMHYAASGDLRVIRTLKGRFWTD